MLPLYRFLLLLYPARYREEFGPEMIAVFMEARCDARTRGPMKRMSFVVGEVGGLLHGAFCEHLRRLTGLEGHPVFSSRRFSMRSEFRFPKATVSLMVIILAGVLVAIDKAKAIQQSVLNSHSEVGPIHATQPLMLLPTLLIILTGACAVAVIAWGILFAFQRSGSHRLSGISPSGDGRTGGRLSIWLEAGSACKPLVS
jgi:hypothetical protein